MTTLVTLRSLLEGRPGVRVVSPTSALEDSGFMTPQSESTASDAVTVDGGPFSVFDVEPCKESGFTHFLDGAQRTWLASYDGFSPICLAHTSAGLVERCGREVLPPENGFYSGELEIFLPTESDLAPVLSELRRPIVRVEVEPVATSAKMQEQIANRVSERRNDREQSLAGDFREGRLLLDGSITNAVADDAFVVGLVKSHRTQYFQSRSRLQQILDLKPGQRTSVFHRPGVAAQGGPAYSFYLKLHESQREGPLYGLIRLEIPPRAEMLEAVDDIASWVLCERCPLSKPDARYDRLLYPIRLVEQHLKARQPSAAYVRGVIGI